MGFRWSLPGDQNLIVSNWLTSARWAWNDHDALMPLNPALRPTIEGARARREAFEASGDIMAADRERQLLEALFDKEMKQFIRRQLILVPALCLYDEDTQEFVIGWIHALPRCVNYVYVKHPFRNRGYGKALLQALKLGEYDWSAFTRAGARII